MSNQVCIIDDDDDVRGVMCYALEFEGIECLSFNSGESAVQYLSKLDPAHYPCMILVDFMMPKMNGVEFLKLLVDEYPNTLGQIPMGLSTARYPDETAELPARAFRLEKPVDLRIFIDMAKYYVSVKKANSSYSFSDS